MVSALLSSLWNALMGTIKVILGILFSSPWYIVNGVYYLVLCVARGRTILTYISFYEKNEDHSYIKEHIIYQKSGFFLCILGFSYLLISIRMFYRGDVTRFPGYAVFAVVIISLIKLCSSIYGLFYDHNESGFVVRVIRMFSLADAGVSIVMTRCALLLIVNAPAAVSNSAIFGMIISVVLMISGIWMWKKPIRTL